jgi:hypothetical protein
VYLNLQVWDDFNIGKNNSRSGQSTGQWPKTHSNRAPQSLKGACMPTPSWMIMHALHHHTLYSTGAAAHLRPMALSSPSLRQEATTSHPTEQLTSLCSHLRSFLATVHLCLRSSWPPLYFCASEKLLPSCFRRWAPRSRNLPQTVDRVEPPCLTHPSYCTAGASSPSSSG